MESQYAIVNIYVQLLILFTQLDQVYHKKFLFLDVAMGYASERTGNVTRTTTVGMGQTNVTVPVMLDSGSAWIKSNA